ncbi:MAG: TIM barrel protein, partial [Bifidobacteriaceae bacterium]|nr:TIM barrel protein [Bifidobacteriaceae bacterium]
AARSAFLGALAQSADAAEAAGARFLIVQTGAQRPGVARAVQRQAVVTALSVAAQSLEGRPVRLLLEALNDRVDHPGHFLTDTADAVGIVRAVAHPSLRLLYDRYHAAVMGERLGYGIDDALDLVEHVHIADMPGRGELGSGGLNWEGELDWIARHLPGVLVGCEYRPKVATDQSLTLLRRYLGQPRTTRRQ